MANDKLQELTQRLYEEGLSKGKQEGEKLLADARGEADRIVAQAQEKAEKILAEASNKANELAAKAASDVKMASSQALDATKADILNAVLAKVVDQNVANVLSGEDFARQVILAVAKNFSTENSCDLEMILPQETKGKLDVFVASEVSKAIGKGIELTFSKKIKGGFQIGPKDGRYFVSLSDEVFSALIREYLRPATSKILFSE